ncbi:ribosomal protein L34-domain-containing protein [Lobosporangium transversale]|uniref:Large ribosomal subunit protein bL34m n=1 Tax=Lobosporangium transversale TaxID=64571 RepID=A0A1Y2GTD9_9FUNG|nr:ribosomal protein L34-domain-containing protein [Lobosporangium transversale]ORZ22760.1 ribosomal protein L34-domain-containing protein [Lobosporangium transversale]|eukprot:XP_021883314.1 ribosomal protein L34-domain-containing protein [Lobosporangium transversale]
MFTAFSSLRTKLAPVARTHFTIFSSAPSSATNLSTITPSSTTNSIYSLLSGFRLPSVFGSSQIRFVTYGREYQPSQRVRKRRHGFLARMKSRGGRKIILNRLQKGRKYLSH